MQERDRSPEPGPREKRGYLVQQITLTQNIAAPVIANTRTKGIKVFGCYSAASNYCNETAKTWPGLEIIEHAWVTQHQEGCTHIKKALVIVSVILAEDLLASPSAGDQDREKLKRSSQSKESSSKRNRSNSNQCQEVKRNEFIQQDITAADVVGNVISVYGATNGQPEVWYYIMKQNLDGVLLQKFGRSYFATTTVDPIDRDTVLNWDVNAQFGKKGEVYISAAEHREQEKLLKLSLKQK